MSINFLLWITFLFFFIRHYRSSRPEVFCENGVLRNFAKFTGRLLLHRKFFMLFLFNFVPQQILIFSFVLFHFVKLISSKFKPWVQFQNVYFSRDSFVFYLFWRYDSPATEIKTYGLVQQLILGMLRDLILQSCDFPSLNGDPP